MKFLGKFGREVEAAVETEQNVQSNLPETGIGNRENPENFKTGVQGKMTTTEKKAAAEVEAAQENRVEQKRSLQVSERIRGEGGMPALKNGRRATALIIDEKEGVLVLRKIDEGEARA